MYADYTFYVETFHGSTIAEQDFVRLASRASDWLDYYTSNKSKLATDAGTLEALAKACCAIAEVELASEVNSNRELEGNGNVKSETIGDWSRTYATAEESRSFASSSKVSLARQYLAWTGLLYRGVR